MNTTFKDIIKAFETFVEDHPQINDFGWGDISNINPSEFIFPMIWLNPINSNTNGNLVTLRFDMYILDVLEQDRTNLLDVMNNTMIIGNDTIAKFWLDNAEELGFELDETKVQMIPFEGRFDELLGSWIFTIEILFKNYINECAIPTSNEVVPETKYYIATLDDVYTYTTKGGVNTYGTREDFPTYSKLGVFDAEPDLDVGDKIYIGFSDNTTLVPEGETFYTITHKEYSGIDWFVYTDYNEMLANAYGKIAKVTEFISCDLSDEYTGTQYGMGFKFTGDITAIYTTGTFIKITTTEGIFYDIVIGSSVFSGTTTITTTMGRFTTGANSVTIEKMSNIV